MIKKRGIKMIEIGTKVHAVQNGDVHHGVVIAFDGEFCVIDTQGMDGIIRVPTEFVGED